LPEGGIFVPSLSYGACIHPKGCNRVVGVQRELSSYIISHPKEHITPLGCNGSCHLFKVHNNGKKGSIKMMQRGIGVGDRPDHPANCNGLIEPYF